MKKNRHRSRLFALLAVSICTFADPAVAADSEAAHDATLGEITVPLPVFAYSFDEIKPHATPEDDEERPSSFRQARSLQVLRACNLLAAGHYDEAIADFKQGLPQWDASMRSKQQAEGEYSLACEKVGLIDDAIKHAKLACADDQLARLYFREHRFAEAKAIADNNVQDNKLSDFTHGSAYNLGAWLQFRAAIQCPLGHHDNAVQDLKDAAQDYRKHDVQASNICAQTANALIQRHNLGSIFKVEATPLPAKGKERVLNLIEFLTTSTNPLNIADLNRIIGSSIKSPKKGPGVYQQEGECRPFDQLEYRNYDDDLKKPWLLMLDILNCECCIAKTEIDARIPSNAVKVVPIDTWTGVDASRHAEAFSLRTGRLFLRFGVGGVNALQSLEFKVPLQEELPLKPLVSRAESHDDRDSGEVDALNQAIKLDDKNIKLYVERSNAFCDLGRFDEALVDAKQAVTLGGRFYLDQQSKVEEKMGNLRDAIDHYRIFLGDHPPGPEATARYTQLATLYLMSKQYKDALETSEKAMIDSKDANAALFVKAQAEAALGNLDKARVDAKTAADGYFDKAQIVLRDRILKWLQTL